MIYADIDGNIGYQCPGKIPIRAGGNGSFPAPGWTNDYEWRGYIPFEDLPRAYNPPEGYVASANNSVVDSKYPYFMTEDWDFGFRAKRITEMIESQKAPITIAYIKQMQGDDKSLNAEVLVPILLKIPIQENHLIQARKVLQSWNYQLQMDQPEPLCLQRSGDIC